MMMVSFNVHTNSGAGQWMAAVAGTELTMSDVWPAPGLGWGHCHPRSTILISFWLQITLGTGQWDTHRGVRGHAKHFNPRVCVWWGHFDSTWIKKSCLRWPRLLPHVLLLTGPGVQTTRADLARGIATTQAGAGQNVSSCGSYWNWELCTTWRNDAAM